MKKNEEPKSKTIGEVYEGRVIHIIGAGATGYMGIPNPEPHPLGWGWLRMDHTCLVVETVVQRDGKGGMDVFLSRLGGPEKVYSTTVDLYVGDLTIEIRIVEPEGSLMASYEKQMDSVFSILVAPSSREAAAILGDKSK